MRLMHGLRDSNDMSYNSLAHNVITQIHMALSILVGSLLGLAGEGFIAVLALSSMGHAGYALLALSGGAGADALFYAVQYAVTTAAFLLLLAGGWAGGSGALGALPVLRSLQGGAGLGLGT